MIPPVNLSLPLEEMDNNNRSIGTGIFPLAAISERPGHNPRKDYGEHDGTFASLVESIKQFGMLQPPVIIPTSTAGDAWHVVSGHRRIAAAKAAGLTELRCLELGWDWTTDESGKDLARETLASYTETEQCIYALIENLQRKELNPIEVAEGVHGLERLGKTQEEIGRWIGRSQGAVSKLSRLLTLPDGVRSYLRTGELSQSHGEELLPLLGECFLTGEIETLASKAVEQQLTANGLRHVVREKIERATPKQVTLEEVAEQAEHSATNNEEFDDARIARTLAATKGLDKSELGSFDKDPKPTPKDTNGLTRKESDAQFQAAMAPDPDVVPLSERPSVDRPKGTFFFLPADAAQLLFELSDWHRQEHGDLITADQKLADIVRSFHQAKLEMKIEAEAAKAALSATLPVFEEPAPSKIKPTATERQPYTYSWIYASPAVGGGWMVNGTCDIWPDDPLPVVHTQQEARDWAQEKSRKCPTLLYQVIVDIYQPAAKTEARAGDFWYFRGERVPGGTTLAGKLPTESVLRSIGAWDVSQEIAEANKREDAELEAQEEPAQSEGASLDLFGMDEAQTTTSLVDDMAGRLV